MNTNTALIIRLLKRKRCDANNVTLKKLVSDYYLMHVNYIDKDCIFNCLFDIIEKYDLLPQHMKGRGFFLYREPFEPDIIDPLDKWIYRAVTVIRLSSMSKLIGCPRPSRFTRKPYNEN